MYIIYTTHESTTKVSDTNVRVLPYPSDDSFVVHYEINKRDMANRLISPRPGVRSFIQFKKNMIQGVLCSLLFMFHLLFNGFPQI